MRHRLEFARQALADGEAGVGALVVRDHYSTLKS